jgi:hypothetical protein
MRWIWNPAHYWPAWLGLLAGLFLLREVWALVTGRPQDTLSDWVWNQLHVIYKQPVDQWDAAHFLFFGLWCVLFLWLTWHFFFRDFT